MTFLAHFCPRLLTGPDERTEFRILCRRVESTIRAWYNLQFEDLNVRKRFPASKCRLFASSLVPIYSMLEVVVCTRSYGITVRILRTQSNLDVHWLVVSKRLHKMNCRVADLNLWIGTKCMDLYTGWIRIIIRKPAS